MTDKEFDQYVKSIMSMCLDVLQKGITKELFISNLEIFVKGLQGKYD
jgi:hypothetical protein